MRVFSPVHSDTIWPCFPSSVQFLYFLTTFTDPANTLFSEHMSEWTWTAALHNIFIRAGRSPSDVIEGSSVRDRCFPTSALGYRPRNSISLETAVAVYDETPRPRMISEKKTSVCDDVRLTVTPDWIISPPTDSWHAPAVTHQRPRVE